MQSGNRLKNFLALAAHPWLCRSFKKLNQTELEMAINFIAQHDALSKGDFFFALHRMFLDKPDKTKHWREIEELLSCCNTASFQGDEK